MEDCSRDRGEGVAVGQDRGAHFHLGPGMGLIEMLLSAFEQYPLTPASFRARNIADPPELSPRANGTPKYSAIAVSASLTWFWPPWYL